MKILIRLGLVLLPLVPCASKAQGAARIPSVQETITWMENYSDSHGYHHPPAGGFISNRIESIGGCEVNLTKDFPNSSPTAFKHVSTKISLATLDPKSVKQVNDADSHSVTVERSDGAMKTHSDVEMGDGRKTFFLSNEETLFFDSEEAAQRFAKALSYVITKCGGSSAPF